MKTAMQELKDRIENKIIPSSKENGDLNEYQYSHNIAYNTVLTIIEFLLEKEKEQIIETSRNSYIAGYLDNQCKVDESMNFPEEYYNQNYQPK